jgi:hypothetical protein
MKRANLNRNRSLASIQKQIILDYINVEGHGVWLDMKGQQRLADRLGMSIVQLKRVLNALARNGDIQLDACNGSPMASPYWYGKTAA